MPIDFELFDTEPILVIHYLASYEAVGEIQQMRAYIDDLTERSAARYQVIFDLTQIKLDFYQVVVALSEAGSANREKPAPFDIIIVGTSLMVRQLVQFARQEQYGRMELPLFDSMDAALEHARRSIGV